MLLAFMMLWAYVTFSQYLIIWSGNLPEEIPWYLARFRGGWGWVGARRSCSSTSSLPFLLLLSRQANRNPRTARRAPRRCSSSCASWTSSWLVLPGLLDGRVPRPLARPRRRRSGSAASGSAFFARNLADRPLLPVNDPGFEEALAHGRE